MYCTSILLGLRVWYTTLESMYAIGSVVNPTTPAYLIWYYTPQFEKDDKVAN